MLGATALRRAALAATFLGVATTSAMAFDSPSPLDWEGFYAGVTISGVVGTSDGDYTGVPPPPDPVVAYDFQIDLSGVGLGGLIGYNRDFGAFVLGIEGDLSWIGGANGRFDYASDRYDLVSLVATGHARARAGYDMGTVMPFVAAGLALAYVEQSHSGPVSGTPVLWSEHALLAGLSVGAGVDIKVTDAAVLRIEIIHDSFGSRHYEWLPDGTRYSNADLNLGTLRAGLTVGF